MSDTERIAVDLAVRYEEMHGRQVIDIGHGWPVGLGPEVQSWAMEHHGFSGRPTCDLVSRHEDGSIARLIEVKGRGGPTSIHLVDRQRTAMLGLSRDWWLYVVLACRSPAPRLVVVEDPARLPWQLIKPPAPGGPTGRVADEREWYVMPNDVLAAGDEVAY